MIRQRIVVVIPAYNEEQSLPLVLSALQGLPIDLEEIVVVDNDSSDGTKVAAESAGATVLVETQRGYGAACLCAIEYLQTILQPNPLLLDIVVFLDADYSDFPEDLMDVVDPIINNQVEFVVGSRLLLANAKKAVPLLSRLGNRFATAIIWLLYGVRFSDLGPFRAITFPALLELQMEDRTWGWTLEMQLKASQFGLFIEEVPVRYRARHSGKSKISHSVIGSIRASAKILSVLLRHIFRGGRPASS